MKRPKKSFDCVEMMHEGALRIHAELLGKTREDQLAYWRRRNEAARLKHPGLNELGNPRRAAE